MKKEKILIIIIVLVVIIGAIFGLYFIGKSTPLRKRMGIQEEVLENLAKKGEVIEITSEGFEGDFFGKEIIVNQGEEVYFVNKDQETLTLVREFGSESASIELEPISTLSYPFMNFGQFVFYLEKWPEEKLKVIVE